MQSNAEQSAVGQIGAAIFGTPNGREVVAQPGVSVAHQDDWVAHAVHALQFDLASDTLVMQRMRIGGATVFWFGLLRYASEIDFNRGGYVGFGAWAVNHRVDGAKLMDALTLAAARLREMTVSDGKFHTSIRAVVDRFPGDPTSFAAMQASAQRLPEVSSIAHALQQPIVLDMRGCSDAWCAQIINLFQTEYSGEALVLARSDTVVDSAARLRLWPVVEPIEWFTLPGRSFAQGLDKQLQAARAEQVQQETLISDLSQRLNAAEGKIQSLVGMEQQLLELQNLAEQEKSSARQARQDLESLRKSAQATINKLTQDVQNAERLANVRLQELQRVRGEPRSISPQPFGNVGIQRPQGGLTPEMSQLRSSLETTKEQNRQLNTNNKELSQENKALKEQLFESSLQQQKDFDKISEAKAKAARDAKSVFWLWWATGAALILAFILVVVLIIWKGSVELELMKRLQETESERKGLLHKAAAHTQRCLE